MIVTELYDGQGLGNQLWVYAVARVLAHRQSVPFSILGQHRFKGRDFVTLDFGASLSGGLSPEGGPPFALPEGVLHYYQERFELLRGTTFDVSRTDPGLLRIPAAAKFDGNCQSTRYLDGYREQLREWIRLSRPPDLRATDSRTCLIHIRAGDFATNPDVFLPASYYRQAMMHMRSLCPDVQFACVSDDAAVAKRIIPGVPIIGSAILQALDRHKASHHLGGPISIDFSLLAQAQLLIIPNSSFSWWAAYLNKRASFIIAPQYWAAYNHSNGYWSTGHIITDGFYYLHPLTHELHTAAQAWHQARAYESDYSDSYCASNRAESASPSQRHRLATLGRRLTRRVKGVLQPPPRKRVISGLGSATKRVVDVFTFFNEFELLDIRLQLLDPHVDLFVLVECTETFSGLGKELLFANNRHRFARYLPKLRHLIIDDVPATADAARHSLAVGTHDPLVQRALLGCLTSPNVPPGQLHWLKEFYQKESICRALDDLDDNDVCFISDVDEIWNPDVAIDFERTGLHRLRQQVRPYFIDMLSAERWAGTIATKASVIRTFYLNHLRTPQLTACTYVPNGGWHFTNQGGADRIRLKLESYGHQEYNTKEIKALIEQRMLDKTDFLGRPSHIEVNTTGLPDLILAQRSRYPNMFTQSISR